MLILYICYDGILDDLGQTQVLPYIYGLNDKGYNFIIFSFERHDRTNEEFRKQEDLIDSFFSETAMAHREWKKNKNSVNEYWTGLS